MGSKQKYFESENDSKPFKEFNYKLFGKNKLPRSTHTHIHTQTHMLDGLDQNNQWQFLK